MSTGPSSLAEHNNIDLPPAAYKYKVVIVRTEWNGEICDELCRGAIEVISAQKDIAYSVITVPGCVEIPFAVAHCHRTTATQASRHTAYIAFGCVIKGETPHFEYVCQSVTNGIARLNTTIESPTVFGILTVLNHAQAEDRLGGAHGHKGKEAAISALKMLALMQTLPSCR
jgi:6,7-dimethyl-8-ribityllumazine synthase